MFIKEIVGIFIPIILPTALSVALSQGPLQRLLPNYDSDQTVAAFIEAISDQRTTVVKSSSTGSASPSTIINSFGANEVPYSGISTFAHLDWMDCFTSAGDKKFDIAIAGMPFDLGVSYRPGARFGPGATRMASRRLLPDASWDVDHGSNPFRSWATVVDCGDISNSPFDKVMAIKQLTQGASEILTRSAKTHSQSDAVRMITIGGDHTITLPLLRATHSVWGPVAVLHFDSHLDTWDPDKMNGGKSNQYSEITHGTMLHLAHKEGLMSNDSNMHLGLRSMMFDQLGDLDNDRRCGFNYIRAREIDSLGINAIVDKIIQRIGNQYVYISIDIDVLDPAYSPATGTIEPGGWSTRELILILQGLSKAGLNIIGADIVELSPIFDNSAETSALLVVQLVYELLHWMVNVPVASKNTVHIDQKKI